MLRAPFVLLLLTGFVSATAEDQAFVGIVSSATPEATAAGVQILEAGGNAVDAAVAVSLALAVTEPAGSGIAGQTVMLIKRRGEGAVVVQGTTWSPRSIPSNATSKQLRVGRTASTVPSTLRVLDVAKQKYGSSKLSWVELLQPAIDYAERGFTVGPFRHRSFRTYDSQLAGDATATAIFLKPDGSTWQVGDTVRQPLLAATLRRIAIDGAMEFYSGDMAKEIASDVERHGGWITMADLEDFPEPAVVPAISATYRGYDVETLPPPFGGWVVLQILNVLEHSTTASIAKDNDERRLALLDALFIGHSSRRDSPITDYKNYSEAVRHVTSKDEAQRLLVERGSPDGGETTHFSVVDADGTAVSVTQSIDSYFGAKVAHPTLGFLYNNYMQGFQVDDPEAPYFLAASEMPMSSMSATIVSRDGEPLLVLGSPGSARIISAVAQVVSHWVDIAAGIKVAVGAYRVHVVPADMAYVEGAELSPVLLQGLADRNLRLVLPSFGVSDSRLDAYFGGVHALAVEDGLWTGAADPRRDGAVETALQVGY